MKFITTWKQKDRAFLWLIDLIDLIGLIDLVVVSAACLQVVPDRSQFFKFESVTLSCESGGNSSSWSVKRNTSVKRSTPCPGTRDGARCVMEDLYPFESGVYWCESASGESSNAVNITVTDGPVILDVPVLPVAEGDAVTLTCRHRAASSNFTADFYKDGVLVGSSSTGNLSIRHVCKSDEGFYSCNVSGSAGSAGSVESWMRVKGQPSCCCNSTQQSPSGSPLQRSGSAVACIVLPVAGACSLLSLLLLLLLCSRYKGRKEAEDVSYTDVIITQDVKAKTRTDTTRRTIHSAVKAGSA